MAEGSKTVLHAILLVALVSKTLRHAPLSSTSTSDGSPRTFVEDVADLSRIGRSEVELGAWRRRPGDTGSSTTAHSTLPLISEWRPKSAAFALHEDATQAELDRLSVVLGELAVVGRENSVRRYAATVAAWADTRVVHAYQLPDAETVVLSRAATVTSPVDSAAVISADAAVSAGPLRWWPDVASVWDMVDADLAAMNEPTVSSSSAAMQSAQSFNESMWRSDLAASPHMPSHSVMLLPSCHCSPRFSAFSSLVDHPRYLSPEPRQHQEHAPVAQSTISPYSSLPAVEADAEHVEEQPDQSDIEHQDVVVCARVSLGDTDPTPGDGGGTALLSAPDDVGLLSGNSSLPSNKHYLDDDVNIDVFNEDIAHYPSTSAAYHNEDELFPLVSRAGAGPCCVGDTVAQHRDPAVCVCSASYQSVEDQRMSDDDSGQGSWSGSLTGDCACCNVSSTGPMSAGMTMETMQHVEEVNEEQGRGRVLARVITMEQRWQDLASMLALPATVARSGNFTHQHANTQQYQHYHHAMCHDVAQSSSSGHRANVPQYYPHHQRQLHPRLHHHHHEQHVYHVDSSQTPSCLVSSCSVLWHDVSLSPTMQHQLHQSQSDVAARAGCAARVQDATVTNYDNTSADLVNSACSASHPVVNMGSVLSSSMRLAGITGEAEESGTNYYSGTDYCAPVVTQSSAGAVAATASGSDADVGNGSADGLFSQLLEVDNEPAVCSVDNSMSSQWAVCSCCQLPPSQQQHHFCPQHTPYGDSLNAAGCDGSHLPPSSLMSGEAATNSGTGASLMTAGVHKKRHMYGRGAAQCALQHEQLGNSTGNLTGNLTDNPAATATGHSSLLLTDNFSLDYADNKASVGDTGQSGACPHDVSQSVPTVAATATPGTTEHGNHGSLHQVHERGGGADCWPPPSQFSAPAVVAHNHSYHVQTQLPCARVEAAVSVPAAPLSCPSSPSVVVYHNVTAGASATTKFGGGGREHLSRDEKRARSMCLPLSNEEIISLPMDEFNEQLSRHVLSDAQLTLVRDIRRRGKNKLAAQNCRRRKLQQIMSLCDQVREVRQSRSVTSCCHQQLLQQRHLAVNKYKQLYCHVLQALRSRHADATLPAQFNIDCETLENDARSLPATSQSAVV